MGKTGTFVAYELFRFARRILGFCGNKPVFRILDFIIHLIESIIKVCFVFEGRGAA